MSPFTPEIIKVLQDDALRRGEHMRLVAEVREAARSKRPARMRNVSRRRRFRLLAH